MWQRLIVKAAKEKGIERFQFRDIRAKAGTDRALNGGEAHKLLGNSPATADRHYIRKPDEVDPNE